MRKLLIPLGLLCLTCVGCQQSDPLRGSAKVEPLLGGAEAYALIAESSRAVTCEGYRIDGYAREAKADKRKKLHGYPIILGPVPIGDTSKATLANILTDHKTYLWNIGKACEFLPGVMLRLADAKTQVDVLICFSCDELEVYTNGKQAGHEDFDPRRADLLCVAKQLFPGDKKIQELE